MNSNQFHSALVEHYLRSNLDQVLSRSLMNCHVEGLHSIMLSEAPEKTIRLYVAELNHPLGSNCHERIYNHQSVGFHAHHCDLTLVPVSGHVANWLVQPESETGVRIPRYQYQSKIKSGKGGFVHHGETFVTDRGFEWMPLHRGTFMAATDVHTVCVPSRTIAAWFVFEGKENPNHHDFCWSFADLENASFDNLYKPMSRQDLNRLLYLAEINAAVAA